MVKKVARLFALSTLLVTIVNAETQCRNFKSIISLGDSIADTGNLVGLSNSSNLPPAAFPPFGENFFHHPTGRFCNGRLIIDFIAEFLGLPLVPPFFGSNNGNFEKGVNFAVGGGTALDCSFLATRGIDCPDGSTSLGIQLKSFKEILPNICGSPSDCRDMIGNALILMGDYYNSLLRLFQEPTKFGFMDRPLPACCGIGGSYNFNFSRICASEGVVSCEDPSKYVNWDGVHMTEAAYKWIADGILKGPYATPRFNWSCLSSEIKNEVSLDNTQHSLMNS